MQRAAGLRQFFQIEEMMSTESKGFNEWAILEIMGHNTYAGRVSEQTVGGASFVRVDVPAVESLQPFTKLFGASSIYCITPVTEEVARARAATLRQQPLTVWDLPESVKAAVRTVERLNAPPAPQMVGLGSDDDDYDDPYPESL